MRKYLTLKAPAPTTYATYRNSGKPLATSLVSLRNLYGPIENQGEEGSCTAFSALQFRYALRKQAGLPDAFDPSEQAQYYEERVLEGTENQDSGAYLEDALQVLVMNGVMPEQDDPYIPQDFAVDPPDSDWNPTLKLNPDRVQHINPGTILADTLDALNNGHPVYFAHEVFQEMESWAVAQTGILPMPGPNEPLLGGHAVNAIGFDPARQMILVLNQWGADWGIKSPAEFQGCFWMPYEYYERYCTDAYVGLPDALWHVEIGNLSNSRAANLFLNAAEQKGLKAYIRQDGKMFKVLVGDCNLQADAEAMLPGIKAAGYNDAFLVEI